MRRRRKSSRFQRFFRRNAKGQFARYGAYRAFRGRLRKMRRKERPPSARPPRILPPLEEQAPIVARRFRYTVSYEAITDRTGEDGRRQHAEQRHVVEGWGIFDRELSREEIAEIGAEVLNARAQVFSVDPEKWARTNYEIARELPQEEALSAFTISYRRYDYGTLTWKYWWNGQRLERQAIDKTPIG